MFKNSNLKVYLIIYLKKFIMTTWKLKKLQLLANFLPFNFKFDCSMTSVRYLKIQTYFHSICRSIHQNSCSKILEQYSVFIPNIQMLHTIPALLCWCVFFYFLLQESLSTSKQMLYLFKIAYFQWFIDIFLLYYACNNSLLELSYGILMLQMFRNCNFFPEIFL